MSWLPGRAHRLICRAMGDVPRNRTGPMIPWRRYDHGIQALFDFREHGKRRLRLRAVVFPGICPKGVIMRIDSSMRIPCALPGKRVDRVDTKIRRIPRSRATRAAHGGPLDVDPAQEAVTAGHDRHDSRQAIEYPAPVGPPFLRDQGPGHCLSRFPRAFPRARSRLRGEDERSNRLTVGNELPDKSASEMPCGAGDQNHDQPYLPRERKSKPRLPQYSGCREGRHAACSAMSLRRAKSLPSPRFVQEYSWSTGRHRKEST